MKAVYRARMWVNAFQCNSVGQDLIEYALMAAFLVVATAALMPAMAANVSKLLSEVGSVLITAKNTGS
jgi:hypothetical protein